MYYLYFNCRYSITYIILMNSEIILNELRWCIIHQETDNSQNRIYRRIKSDVPRCPLCNIKSIHHIFYLYITANF